MFGIKPDKEKNLKNLSEKDIQKQLYGDYLKAEDRVEVMDSSFIVREGKESPILEKVDQKARKEVGAELDSLKSEFKRLQGEVHDDNTWGLGGISSHAGLFGSIDDLAGFGLQLRAQIRGEAGARVGQATAGLFTQRAIPREAGDWALGFMMPALQGASCGRHFSERSIGHTGFTGTSLWYDPDRDLLVSILSNRVFGGRENKAFLTLRPQMHDWIVEHL